jgi:hypothetical protein
MEIFMATVTSSRFGSLENSSALHLPMPGLYVDLDAASGSVAMTDEFLEASPASRISILQQWTRGLSILKDSAIVEMFREFAAPLCGLTIVEQIDRFRHHCSSQGLSCPADFAVLLQRY